MIEVYGREGCSYCTKARELLDERDISYEYIQLGVDVTKEEFVQKFPGQKTVPVIVAYGMKVGGYSELVDYIEETSGGLGENFK